MKIRNGFVSNSSSSSFIIALPKNLTDKEKIKKALFGYPEEGGLIYLYDEFISKDRVAEIVFQDINNIVYKHEDLKQAAYETLESGTYDRTYVYDYKLEIGTDEYDDYDWKRKRESMRMIMDFFNKNEDKDIYVLRYEDDHSEGRLMEHGGVFNGIPHIKVGEH